MIHDPDLIEQLQDLPIESFSGKVFRATDKNRDPTAFARSAGRWSPRDDKEGFTSILYTSLEREGAIAEVASYRKLLSPVPRASLKVSEILVSVKKTLRILVDCFGRLGIEESEYAERNYERTRVIGAAIHFLEFDGIIAPSARWRCDNLMIFANNHELSEDLEVVSDEIVPYEQWVSYGGEEEV